MSWRSSSAAELDESDRSPVCAPAPLAHLFGDAGLAGVATFATDVPTELLGQG